MQKARILGIVVGECEEITIRESDHDIRFHCFTPNENLYKLLPDFPKKFHVMNELLFDFVDGKIYLTHRPWLEILWQRIFEIKIDFNNLKEIKHEQ